MHIYCILFCEGFCLFCDKIRGIHHLNAPYYIYYVDSISCPRPVASVIRTFCRDASLQP